MQYDVIIIGGAAAGLTAAIYTSRRNLKTLILTKNLGGQMLMTPLIENYPGFKEISGAELTQKFEEQVRNFGVEINFEEVEKINGRDGDFTIKTSSNEYKTKTIILAFGKTPRSLNVPGEKELTGKGVSYCAICDMPLFGGKTVAVVGGGNSALDAALLGSDIAKKVFLVHRRKEFRGFEALVEKVKERKNVELILDSVVTEFKGSDVLKSITVQDVNTKQDKKIDVDGVFIEVGYETKTDWLKDIVKLDENGQIIITDRCETSTTGIFAAGDVTTVPFKQIVISAGDGAKAGLQAYNHIRGVEAAVTADWFHVKR